MLINFRDMQNKVFENKNWVYGVNKVPIMFLLPVYETTGFIFVQVRDAWGSITFESKLNFNYHPQHVALPNAEDSAECGAVFS